MSAEVTVRGRHVTDHAANRRVGWALLAERVDPDGQIGHAGPGDAWERILLGEYVDRLRLVEGQVVDDASVRVRVLVLLWDPAKGL